MIQAKLDSIRDKILQLNTYFNNGYSDVIQDAAGIIRNEKEVLFPDDKKGKYFYLRQPDKFDFVVSSMDKISDCRPGLALKGDIVLVAYAPKADAAKVFLNLYTTLTRIDEVYIKSGITQPERVVLQELSKSSEEAKKKGMANIGKDVAIVSIMFAIELGIYNTCIVDPCIC